MTGQPAQPAPEEESAPRGHWELVGRLRGGNRDEWLYAQAYDRGLGCFFCGSEVDVWNYDVHHFNKSFRPLNARENTAPAHHNCNSASEREAGPAHPESEKKSAWGSAGEFEESDPAISLMRRVGYTREASAEMRARGEGYVVFARWLWATMLKGAEFKRQVIAGGAWASGLTTATIRRYLEPYISDDGPLMEEGEGWDKKVHFRPATLERVRAAFGAGGGGGEG
jgi:hypothetical protein